MIIAALNDTHDSSVCTINNGVVDFFCKEERIFSRKRESDPRTSIKILESLKKDIDVFLYCTPSNTYNDDYFPYKKTLEVAFNTKVINYSSLKHHLCHASLAFYNSKFKKCLVFVIDRNGSVAYAGDRGLAREAESVFLCEGTNTFRPLYKNFWIAEKEINNKNLVYHSLKDLFNGVDIKANSFLSIVKVYEAATSLIGQNVLENGKTMGLSSYGKNPTNQYFYNGDPIETKFFPLFPDNSDDELMQGQVCFNEFYEHTTKDINQQNFQFYADRALEVQQQTQDQVLNLIKKYIDKTNVKNVCLVGGYGLNVVANGYFVKNLPGVNFYFEPISDDTGIPIGACMLEYANLTNKKPKPIENQFFHYYDNTEVLEGGKQADVELIVEMLEAGKSIALFDGNPESGPRALGHRSILFDPRVKNGKDIVNQIKKREWYRPFAGVVLEEKFEEFFDTMGLKSSPNMTVNFYAREGVKDYVPSIIHVDNSCRVQTVSDGFLYDLLKQFYKKTSCPMLLNTSFNLAGKPLVQTKGEALQTLSCSSLDAVFFVQDKKLFTK